MKRFVFFILLLACAVGCSPRLYQGVTQYDTLVVYKQRVDSTFVRDSIFIREKGDTVFKYVEHWRDRIRIVHDTTYRSVTDTLRITEIKKVEKELSWWQRIRMSLGDVFMIVAGILLIVFVVKRFILKL